MPEPHPSQISELLERSVGADTSAMTQLLDGYRTRLRQFVDFRLDQRIAKRVDASDIVQDALVEATGKLAAYAADPKIAFYPWLRQIAFEQLIAQHRRHLGAQLRTVLREEAGSVNASSPALVERLIASETSPTRQAANKERKAQVMAAVDRLKPIDREVLVLRFVEQLSTKEAADVLGLSERGVKTRQRRAIERISSLVQEDLDER